MGLVTGAGRIGRLHYFGINLACAIALVLPFLVGTTVDPDTGQAAPMSASAALILLLVVLAGAWLGTANAIRRLHDCGRTGWLVLLSPVPLVGFGLGLYLLFNPGDPLPNRFGPPPGTTDPEAMRAQLAQLEAVTAPYRQPPAPDGTAPGDPAPAPSSWPDDGTFDAGALYRDNPGLTPPADLAR